MLLVAAYPGQPSVDELERRAAAGERPRKDYVEIARALDADVLDFDHMQHRASRPARLVASRAGVNAGQVLEAFLSAGRYRYVCAWADRIGLPLALLNKLLRRRRDLVLVSAWLSIPKKAVFLERLKVASHLKAIINYSSVQMEIAAHDLGVPESKLHLAKQPVDDRFWRPEQRPEELLICAVGWEARDYPTLVEAVRGLDVQVRLAVGNAGLSSSAHETSQASGNGGAPSPEQFGVMKGTYSYDFYEQWMRSIAHEGLPPNVAIDQQLDATRLRDLYARSRFVVVPLLDVDSDCGVTSITEAMAMGKAVVLSRTRGQVDIVEDEVHGVYVPPGDPAALRATIERLLEHPDEAGRMGRAGREAVERTYSLDRYVAQVAGIVLGDDEHYQFELYRRQRRSLGLQVYYRVRPLLPRRLQIALRRGYSRRQKWRRFPAWPIEPLLVDRQEAELRRRAAGHGERGVPLVNYWPGDHRFAFVLTHDVESAAGIERIRAVREVEERYGFVSSWNFCAESYAIPEGLFDELRAAGCEIGLHGLDHRGRLFESRAAFDASLPRIHRYLREWGADGFRAPALQRRAEWTPLIGAAYDSSFPDTDPFEPQPGGCCSIFPFMIGDTVELPVTLAQDHTLFEILRHRDIDIWTRKAGWIAEHHGLVNVIVHPDYTGDPERLELYDRLLAFLAAQEGGWHALPREVAEWWRLRTGLRCEGDGADARVVGPGAERAAVAYARPDGERVVIGP